MLGGRRGRKIEIAVNRPVPAFYGACSLPADHKCRGGWHYRPMRRSDVAERWPLDPAQAEDFNVRRDHDQVIDLTLPFYEGLPIAYESCPVAYAQLRAWIDRMKAARRSESSPEDIEDL